MSTEPPPSQDPKRLFLFMVLSLALITGTNFLLSRFGLLPEPEPEPPQDARARQVAQAGEEPGAADEDQDPDADAPAAEDGPEDQAGEVAEADADPADPAEGSGTAPEPEGPSVALADPDRLVLGSIEDQGPGGYHLQVHASQGGASLVRVRSSRHSAEFEGIKPEQRRPMTLVQSVAPGHRPLALQALGEDEEGLLRPVGDLDRRPWQVVVGETPLDDLDEEARAQADPVEVLRDAQGDEVGQRIRFRATLDEPADLPPVEITKTFTLRKGADAVELDLDFRLPGGADEPRDLVYRLDGPSGIPIEGEWYTHTFRNAYFGKGGEGEAPEVWTYSSLDVAKDQDEYVNTERPTAFAGVENQYFATFLKPEAPTKQVAEAVMAVVDADERDLKKADVAVDLISEPVAVEPGPGATHSYALFAGPKTDEALTPYGAEGLAIYRQVGRVPIIGWLFDILWAIVDPIVALISVYAIGPLLAGIYGLTARVSGWFGGTRGSYGVAIILLTVVVRLVLFPLSRKQAASAKKMQELQPQMMELRKKYGSDDPDPQKRQEAQQRVAQETFALYRKHGVNPLGGCLPVFVQIPIFMTLWRVLNVSVSLRQAPFLWIENLAAPDMLVKLPFTLPLLGPYFNLLPLGVIGLFLLQMKLFTPPATSPEQEAQQRIMKFMMVFMMLMFYRVPAGLALYFITSSMWAIGERLLLPKVSPSSPPVGGDDGGNGKGRGPSDPDSGPNGGGPGGGWLSRKLDALMKEAAKANETTYRREDLDRPRRDLDRGAEREGDRDRPGKRKSKPGKRR
ncbi:YidC/Oxa1 family insertase periplasmic-domain containing protein [Tautonia plasticadhaerens]|uniref:Membrane protein insertase YidC n=1 Tax=Tautonia plasticadhaerens TaxID=2527974 RepID=A0A518GZP9_9BACT|nr:YidC/Oxa1 family insertase periplasmic-domain containing protein [Tautonia plasticadhaerens]QDV34068.1 Membrane protein insertase YidC [Tautonia plasticadhaerens]